MFCPNCGNEMNDSSNFCTECGWKKNKQIFKGFDFSKKYLCIAGIVFVVLALFVLIKPKGKVYSFKDIARVKLVTEYNDNTTIDQMDTVTFGSYPQNDVTGNAKEPIEWIVLDRQGDKALLLSKYKLDCKCYNDVSKDITWENCTLRYWLNNTFYNTAFSSSEKSYIDNTYVINNDNASYNTNGGNNTYDNVFLLSIDEANKYFYQSDMHTSNLRLATRRTNYTKNVDNNDISFFWLRSPGIYQNTAAIVMDNGSLSGSSYIVEPHRGVRPALWVSNLSSSISKSNVEEIQNNKNSISTNQNYKSLILLIILIIVLYLHKDKIINIINNLRNK